MRSFRLSFYMIFLLFNSYSCFSGVGKWNIQMNGDQCGFSLPKTLYAGSQIFVILHCTSAFNFTVTYSLSRSKCSPDFYHFFQKEMATCDGSDGMPYLFLNDTEALSTRGVLYQPCTPGISIPLEAETAPSKSADAANLKSNIKKTRPLATVEEDGIYVLDVFVHAERARADERARMSVEVEMAAAGGQHLSAALWPLLPLWGSLCGLYAAGGLAWLAACAARWREILRLQYWIGGVALLGLVESALHYAVYAHVDATGYFAPDAYLLAELVSVAKRALARMLVIIVSLGFGIVKPRLGGALQRVVGCGALWAALAALETWLRLRHAARSANTDLLLAEAPLSLLDSAICWWIFVSLAHTMRTLQLRRNTVKLSLYRHFMNTLVFAVISSVVFMLYSIKTYRLSPCLTKWKEVWVDEAYWHLLFACLLAVIMVLWRPTNNNQRYAFTPLLDNVDDESEEEDQLVNDAYGVKLRGVGAGAGAGDGERGGGGGAHSEGAQEDDDLRWVEEHIPAAALPLLDSDDEIINTKFEVSKMQ